MYVEPRNLRLHCEPPFFIEKTDVPGRTSEREMTQREKANHGSRDNFKKSNFYNALQSNTMRRLGEVESERPYIRNEVRTLVRRNKDLKSTVAVNNALREFEARIEIGLHYNIASPRQTNVMPGATGLNPSVVTPVYLHSYKSSDSSSASKTRKSRSIPVYDD